MTSQQPILTSKRLQGGVLRALALMVAAPAALAIGHATAASAVRARGAPSRCAVPLPPAPSNPHAGRAVQKRRRGVATAALLPGRKARTRDGAFPLPGLLNYAYISPDLGAPEQVEVVDLLGGGPVTAGGVLAFAVSSSRMVLALADGKRRVRVYSLHPPYRRLPWRGPQPLPRFHPMLLPTCGTIAAWTKHGIVDGLTGRQISISGYWRPACSADRKVAAGASEAALRRLLTGGPFPAPTLYLGRRSLGPADVYYAVSPRGKYVAWVAAGSADRPGWPVCVLPTRGSAVPRCTPYLDLGWAADAGASLDSVADDGTVIFAAQSQWRDCPGCRSVYLWTPRAAPMRPVLMHPRARDPQWITPAAARGLIARYKYLRAHRKLPARKGPRGSKKARLPAA